MHALLVGGTRFIGRAVVERLRTHGHQVTLFHRGETGAELWPDVPRILGDRRNLAEWTEPLRAAEPDVVIDMMLMTEADARGLVEVFAGFAPRVIAISSADVYRAFGRVLKLEEGAAEPGTIDETTPLRSGRYPYRGKLPHLDDYDKILVEETVHGDARLAATVLRLPMVYGPFDAQRRFFDYLKRMDDGRPAILLDERAAGWRITRAFVDDVAAAIVLCATTDAAAGRTYNVGEPDAPTTAEWVERLAVATGFEGRVVALPPDRCPEHLRADGELDQDVILDTSRIRQELGYAELVDRGEALRRTVAWERAHPTDEIDAARFDYPAEDAALSE